MKTLPKTQPPRRRARSLLTAMGAMALVAATSLMAAAPAQASDWGGDGDSATCDSPFTVVSTPIYGTRGNLIGKKIAELQMRWSWSCYGNWSRVVLDGGNYPDTVTVEQRVESEGKSAGALDWVTPGSTGATAWIRYVRLANSQSPACVQAWLSSDFGTPNFHTNGARVCA
ncbi:hypothetical protein G7043_41320 [Lentzea sp. NEAU-D13]|uniref:DUF2690 domain-containing protein n=1 Tax=Lentzea alba TaxID=2714351 RepID=A0A7C9VV20_9PSEU|nr:hypothetical protein [Lentzea alba]NGY65354.1 hypothetical protein [Lentzea alba]